METFNVTVAPKTESHPYFGRGHPFGYVINGRSGATLELERGKTYQFRISAPGHPFYFTTDPAGGAGAPGNLINPDDIIEEGTLEFHVGDELPDRIYYQCAKHSYMGGPVYVIEGEYNESARIKFSLTTVASGFVSPVAAVQTMLDPLAYYVADQVGIVHRFDMINGKVSKALDLQHAIVKDLSPDYDERGLLGLAFHPTKPLAYIYYSGGSTDDEEAAYYNHVSQFGFDIVTHQLDPRTEITLLRIPASTRVHNGGNLLFGPDGFLYVGVGDGGPQGDPHGRAQNLADLHGKILRIWPTDEGYAIPPNNPFAGQESVLPEIYAYGFRNPWGMTFLPDGRLIVADPGYMKREEVSIVVAGGNYGWPIREGTVRGAKILADGELVDVIDPVFEYERGQFNDIAPYPDMVSIIGGYMTSQGYVCGDLSGVLLLVDGITWNLLLAQPIGAYVKAFATDKERNLYVLTSQHIGPYGKTGTLSRVAIN